MSKKEKILAVSFNVVPKVRVRVQSEDDKLKVIEDKRGKKVTLWNDKERHPFKLDKDVICVVQTDIRKFAFRIKAGYVWNGADIPRFLWRAIGSQYDPQFLVSSMIHDYILEYKTFVLCEVLNENMSIKEYRRITSLIFRECLKKYGIKTVKSNVMAWCVDTFQATANKGAWKL